MSDFRKAGSRTNISTDDFGTEVLTIAANVATPTSRRCRLMHVIVPSGNTGNVTMRNAVAAADADDPVLPEDYTNVVPVCDPSLATFYSGTNGDKVFIIWFN